MKKGVFRLQVSSFNECAKDILLFTEQQFEYCITAGTRKNFKLCVLLLNTIIIGICYRIWRLLHSQTNNKFFFFRKGGWGGGVIS